MFQKVALDLRVITNESVVDVLYTCSNADVPMLPLNGEVNPASGFVYFGLRTRIGPVPIASKTASLIGNVPVKPIP